MGNVGIGRELSGYHDVVRVTVEWGDQDALGHVNNAVFMRWFEIGRIAYFQRLGLSHNLATHSLAPILAAVSCTFKRQVRFPDQIRVGTRVTKLGTSSMVVDHVIVSERQEEIVAEGSSTIVHYDYEAQRSCAIPDEIRRIIGEIEAATRDRTD